jgi:23S rRNA-/tRNA-specific pseudouridylate synthase
MKLSLCRFYGTKTSSKSPLDLVNGIYNPPASMSKNSAKKWAAYVQMKDPTKRVVMNGYEVKSFIVPESLHNQKLSIVAKKAFSMKMPALRKRLDANEVWLEGSLHGQSQRITTQHGKLSAGDKLCILFKKKNSDPEADRSTLASNMNVLYRDERIIIINKPVGAVHGIFIDL